MAYYFKIEKELVNNDFNKTIQVLQDKIIQNAGSKIASFKVNIAYKLDETINEAKKYLMTCADSETDKFYLFTRATFELWFVEIDLLKEASDYYVREKTNIYKKIKAGHKVKSSRSNTRHDDISIISNVFRAAEGGTYVDVRSASTLNIHTGELAVHTYRIERFAEKIYLKLIDIIK